MYKAPEEVLLTKEPIAMVMSVRVCVCVSISVHVCSTT